MVVGMLTDQQIETYRRDGYLVIPRLIQGEQLAELRDLTDRIVGEARGVSANDDLYDLEPTHSAALPRVRRLKPVIFKRYAFFHALARDPKITSILAQLLGPAIRQHGGKLNMKSAGYGSPVEWHQDWAFYPHTNDDVLATGIYLDDCTSNCVVYGNIIIRAGRGLQIHGGKHMLIRFKDIEVKEK